MSRTVADQARTQAETSIQSVNTARASLAEARAQLALAQKAVSDVVVAAPFSGFINPRLVPVTAPGTDEITDVRVEYPADFAEQMLEYAASYSFLPNVN